MPALKCIEREGTTARAAGSDRLVGPGPATFAGAKWSLPHIETLRVFAHLNTSHAVARRVAYSADARPLPPAVPLITRRPPLGSLFLEQIGAYNDDRLRRSVLGPMVNISGFDEHLAGPIGPVGTALAVFCQTTLHNVS